MTDTDEWLTVPEAAARLGIPERRAYRLAARLSDGDCHLSDGGRKLVRRSAIERLAGAGGAVRRTTVSDRHASDTDSHLSDGAREASEALVAQMRQENERLNAALERAQGALSQALGALADEQRRSRQLEETQARLIQALPAPTDEAPAETPSAGLGPAPETPNSATGGPGTGGAGNRGTEATPAQGGASETGAQKDSASVEVKPPVRTWWQRLWGRP